MFFVVSSWMCSTNISIKFACGGGGGGAGSGGRVGDDVDGGRRVMKLKLVLKKGVLEWRL